MARLSAREEDRVERPTTLPRESTMDREALKALIAQKDAIEKQITAIKGSMKADVEHRDFCIAEYHENESLSEETTDKKNGAEQKKARASVSAEPNTEVFFFLPPSSAPPRAPTRRRRWRTHAQPVRVSTEQVRLAATRGRGAWGGAIQP